MVLIQIVLLAALITIAVALVRSTADARHQALRRIFIIALAVLAVVSVLWPEGLTWVAELVGVGRGTDLLLYGTVVAFLGFVVSSYRRGRELESRIAELTRRLALDEAGPAHRSDPPA